jgi:hypothetical protein
MFPQDYSSPDSRDGIVRGKLALWVVRNRFILGIILNLLTGYLGWFLKPGPPNTLGVLFLIATVITGKLRAKKVELDVLILFVSNITYGFVTYREIKFGNTKFDADLNTEPSVY